MSEFAAIRARLMRPARLRRLTATEQALGAEMFGAGLNASRVRLFAIPGWSRAFVAGPSLIVWPARTALLDFGAQGVPLRLQGVFVHELTHVWQAQNGINLLMAKLRSGDDAAAYAYDLAGGAAFTHLNIEQQAMVVEHAFLASRGAHTPFAATDYAAAQAAWRRV